jgi:hypothetical protein
MVSTIKGSLMGLVWLGGMELVWLDENGAFQHGFESGRRNPMIQSECCCWCGGLSLLGIAFEGQGVASLGFVWIGW